jgi:HD-GYP domain-containing protein (c-di-GMP phosphodiesterase class II)
MALQHPLAPEEPLLQELIHGLSARGAPPELPLGLVGSRSRRPQPPAYCLQECLGDDPTACESRGCHFLANAARNVLDPTTLRQGRCDRGFRVAAQHTTIGGESAVLVTVQADAPLAPPELGYADLVGHLDSAAQLIQRIDQVMQENAGFVQETLQNYEQLNLIFDLTQRIAQVTDARAIEKLLLERVARLMMARNAFLITADGECRVYEAEGRAADRREPRPPLAPARVTETVDLVRRTRRVQVGSIDSHQVIAGPLVRLDDHVDVVLALRSTTCPSFMAGDMLVVESVLAFGGQIISNAELHEQLRRLSLQVTRALVAAIDKKDHYTSGHSERVGLLTRLTAQQFGLSLAELQIMEWAGLLHDIGKIGIPEEILCKPGKLTSDEFDVVKRHPRMGYEILEPIATLELVLDGVLYHHEQPDGAGYPAGLKGEKVPLVARIIHVADTFDALTSTRSYRHAFTLEKALEIIRQEQGVRIDHQAAQNFFRALEAYRRDQPADFAAQFGTAREQETAYAAC